MLKYTYYTNINNEIHMLRRGRSNKNEKNNYLMSFEEFEPEVRKSFRINLIKIKWTKSNVL